MTLPLNTPSNLTFNHVGLLMGGSSSEREISLRSGRAVAAALQRSGITVTEIDLSDNWAEQIQHAAVDAAFIVLHGTLGEDGAIQGLLEIMQIPYTGSNIAASALCMHKQFCKILLERAELQTPVDIPLNIDGPVRYPVILKPIAEGSSVGLHTLNSKDEWDALNLTDVSGWMAEIPVQGPEIAVSVLDGKALPPVEVAPRSGVYDYASKYTAGATEYFCPARLPVETLRLCMQRAEEAVKATECRGAPRVDMIVADGGEPVILEVNTIPGMTETSLLPKAAAAAGINFDELCCRILATATLYSPNVQIKEVLIKS